MPNLEIVEVVAKEYVLRFTEEEAKALRDLYGQSSSAITDSYIGLYAEENKRYFNHTKALLAPIYNAMPRGSK